MIAEDILRNLYLVKNLTRKEIAKELSVSERQVKDYLSRYNIKKPLELKKVHCKGGHTLNHVWWTNGEIETCAIECPGDGWYRGRSPSAKEKQKLAVANRVLSEKGLANLRRSGKLRKGAKVSEETKQRISEYWKTHDHPFKGKPRKKETRDKISEKLMGHFQVAPKRDLIESLDYNKCMSYIKEDNTIDFIRIYNDLGITNNQYSWQQVQDHFNSLNIKYKKYTSSSLEEKEIFDYIRQVYKGEIIENYKKALDNYEIDIFIPEFNLGIEYNGAYWHKTMYKKVDDKYVYCSGKPTIYHQKKSILAREKGIRLIHIWEDQWKDVRLQPIIKGILNAALHVVTEKRIGARQCTIRDLSNKEYKEFCDKHHTQLSRPAEIKLGLFYKDTLVQLMSFSKYRALNKKSVDVKYDYELVRGCESFNSSPVNGGVSRLLKFFIKKYDPDNIVCYSDLNLFNGIGYERAGFKLEGITTPDKFYITNDRASIRIKRSAKKYREYMEKVIQNELLCCYGAGNLKYVWKKMS